MGPVCPKSPNERFPKLTELPNNPTWLPVVAAALTDADGRLLMHRRPPGKRHAGLWEFPGGKVESGEIPALALVREIDEELGIELDPSALEPVAFAESRAETGFPAIVILLYRAGRWRGEPRALEGGELGWFDRGQAWALPKPPLDVMLLDSFLRLS
jgi:8-oxo-dGTP diphosphatase